MDDESTYQDLSTLAIVNRDECLGLLTQIERDVDELTDEIGKDVRFSRILLRGSLFRWGEHYARVERIR